MHCSQLGSLSYVLTVWFRITCKQTQKHCRRENSHIRRMLVGTLYQGQNRLSMIIVTLLMQDALSMTVMPGSPWHLEELLWKAMGRKS